MRIFFLSLLICSTSILAAVDLSKLKPLNHEAKIETEKSTHTLLVFWATWCVTCKDKLKTILPEISSKNPDLKIIPVSIDKTFDRPLHFLKKYEITMPTYFDQDEVLAKELSVSNCPTWALLKNEGKEYKLLDKQTGFDQDKIFSYLKKN